MPNLEHLKKLIDNKESIQESLQAIYADYKDDFSNPESQDIMFFAPTLQEDTDKLCFVVFDKEDKVYYTLDNEEISKLLADNLRVNKENPIVFKMGISGIGAIDKLKENPGILLSSDTAQIAQYFAKNILETQLEGKEKEEYVEKIVTEFTQNKDAKKGTKRKFDDEDLSNEDESLSNKSSKKEPSTSPTSSAQNDPSFAQQVNKFSACELTQSSNKEAGSSLSQR